MKTTHLHILGGRLLEVPLHFPFLVDLKYYLIYIYVLYIILVMIKVRGRESLQTKKRGMKKFGFSPELQKNQLSFEKLAVPKIKPKQAYNLLFVTCASCASFSCGILELLKNKSTLVLKITTFFFFHSKSSQLQK